MTDTDAGPVVSDLFGHPVAAGTGKAGRPRKVASPQDHDKVKLLLAMGWSTARIAAAVRMSEPTFRREFRAELKERDMMRDRLEARRLELAMTEATRGNIGALRELGKLIERNDLMQRQKDLTNPDKVEPSAKRPLPKGKKEIARSAAADLLEHNALLNPTLVN